MRLFFKLFLMMRHKSSTKRDSMLDFLENKLTKKKKKTVKKKRKKKKVKKKKSGGVKGSRWTFFFYPRALTGA